MKRNILIIIGALVIISLVTVLTVFTITSKQTERKIDDVNLIQTVSEIELNSKQYINQLEKVRIKGTNNTVIITKQVKWEVPEQEESETVSFAISIPYTITVDGKEYEGIYQLGSSTSKAIDNNPQYNFEVTNLTKNGDIEVLITNKSSANNNINNDISLVYLKINCNGKDMSKSFKKGEKFECILLGEKFEITINNITDEKVELKSNSYGLFPQREDKTISLIAKVDTFELYKNKKLVLMRQVTDASSRIEIIWQ